MRVLWVVAAGLVLASCGPSPTPFPDNRAEVTVARALDFGLVVAGAPRTLALAITSTASETHHVRAEASPGFTLAQEEFDLAAKAHVELRITADPIEETTVSGRLRLSVDGRPVLVTLSWDARLPPPCLALDACHMARFDPAKAACIDAPAPDGTDCSDSCRPSARCKNGVCEGTALDCSDRDACTIDACDSRDGCVQRLIPTDCESPCDPCSVPLCDPLEGCGSAPAADGTRCGPSDCTTEQVCLAGSCTARPTPEGAACGESSPCRGAGTCRAGACDQPAAQPIRERWSLALPEGGASIAVDDEDNLYWFEGREARGNWPAMLVSWSADGSERFRVPLDEGIVGAGPVLAGGLVLYARGASVEARTQATGALVWSQRLADEGTVPHVVVQGDQVVADLARPKERRPLRTALHALALATGAPRWTRELAGDAPLALMGDERGRIYSQIRENGIAEDRELVVTLAAFAADGTPLWAQRETFFSSAVPTLLGIFDGVVALSHGLLLAATDGSASDAPLLHLIHDVAFTPGAGAAIGVFSEGERFGSGFFPFAPHTPRRLGQHLVERMVEHGSILPLAQGWALVQPFRVTRCPTCRHPGTDIVNTLKVLDARGELLGTCQFPLSAIEELHLAVLSPGGRLFGVSTTLSGSTFGKPVLRAYDLPGLAPATRGWLGRAGNVARTGSPR